ncbi:efflux RND transporter periplasmic adaptor subunit [Cellulomonas cellasea]|uniref:Peptidoglycan binding-like domain-containing protein n=2 Tax=Cellulomonas cellasea TaxID=43670 RepID=A0A0A0B411_9CELL|nr:peptidoglycan-binding protein [Cellulomonas cellasea]KGM00908.1 hypothetical protein Q760_05340 [Cellulomonas cellasea DSM 20118]GEA87207.1 peptidoglycan-binding protein [Cellulomonas cellasea]
MSARRRTRIALALVAVAALGGTATGLAVASGTDGRDDAAPETVTTGSHTVTRQDLVDAVTVPGVLDFGEPQPTSSGIGGVLTGLPAIGTVVDRGGSLFRVDDTPVVLLLGTLPAWRAFDVSMSEGPDVTQLEDNLRALGFFGGEPDSRFDRRTREAVRDWQESLGLPRTGQVELGRVVFVPSPRRVGAVTAALGDQVGPGADVLTLTSPGRVVTVELPVADQRVAQQGARVTVRLPGGTDVPGAIASVGSPTEVTSGSDTTHVILVGLTLDDPGAAGDLQRISVTVVFQRGVHEGVLAVPVTALLALPGGGFGVEKRTAAGIVPVPVETGSFVQGFVEITAGDLHEGDDVVVPA